MQIPNYSSQYFSTISTAFDSLNFDISLNEWLHNDQNKSQKAEAASRIRNCYASGAASLDLENLNLNSIPSMISLILHLENLNLSNNRLTYLPKEITSLSNLKSLDLSKNQITVIPPEIGSLSKLERLHLGQNQLISLPNEIGSLTDLQMLGISQNELTSLPLEIGSLSNLKILNLRENKLTSIPGEISSLSNLNGLYLDQNRLTSIPLQICSLLELEELNLDQNLLTGLPKELGSLLNLKTLNLAHNQLTSLRIEIGSLTKLDELNLSDNQLTFVPKEIGLLLNLTELNLSHNQLTSLPKEIVAFEDLYGLNLSHNKLIRIPEEISSFSSLADLDLSHNQLTVLPLELGRLTSLESLDISGNIHLKQLPLNLTQLFNLAVITYTNTQIPAEIVLSILECSKQKKDYLFLINVWMAAAGLKKEVTAFNHLKAEDKEILGKWLMQLMQIKDYCKQQKRLAVLVLNIIDNILKHPEFMRVVISQIMADNDCCSDRTSMSLNIIYTFSCLYELPHSASFAEKLDLLIRGAKTNALRRILIEKITKFENQASTATNKDLIFVENESVEIFLYYETALKEKLNLLTAVNQMSYEEIGKRDWIELDKLQEEIEENFIEDLMSIPVFQSLIQEEESIKNKLSEIQQKYQKKSESLEKNEPKKNESSDEYLDWFRKNNEMKDNYHRENKETLLEEIKIIQGIQISGSKRRKN